MDTKKTPRNADAAAAPSHTEAPTVVTAAAAAAPVEKVSNPADDTDQAEVLRAFGFTLHTADDAGRLSGLPANARVLVLPASLKGLSIDPVTSANVGGGVRQTLLLKRLVPSTKK